MRYVYVPFFIILSLHAATAQDLKQALEKLRSTYAQTDRFHIVMSIKAYDDDKAGVPYYDERADIRRSGNSYLYRFGSSDMLMNEKYLIMVDRGSKEIICDKRSIAAETETFKDMMKANVLDSILQFYEQPEYVGQQNGVDHYRVFQKKGAIRQIDLLFRASDHLLQGINYHYRNKQYVTIEFDTFDMNPVFASHAFHENQYVTITKGKIAVADAFRNYTVIEASMP